MTLLWAATVQADPVRIATYHLDFNMKGPGLLLRDLTRAVDPGAKTPKAHAIADVISRAAPDILVLQGIDWDYEGRTLAAFQALMEARGAPYPHAFALRPNTGLPTDLDLDGDGRVAEPRDAQGYGRYPGQAGMAVLSRHPILADQAQDFSDLIWADMPGATLPRFPDGSVFPSAEAAQIQRLSTTGHWVVPVQTPGGILSVLTLHASPPVFDGPEDRNGLRNADEVAMLSWILDGQIGSQINAPWVVAGNLNLDPSDGQGRREAVQALLARSDLTDPKPQSRGAQAAKDPTHRGDPALDTVDWSDDGPGNLRVSYVLPHRSLTVTDAAVEWPPGDTVVAAASRHRLVWVDVTLP